MNKLETLRHSTAHILAYAVKSLFTNVKLSIGPPIENGFYYDFDKKEPFTPDDLKKIEKKIQELINKDIKFEKIYLPKEETKKQLKDEPYKLELLNELKDQKVSFYKSGDFIDLCKGPHIKSTKEIKAFKLLKVAGAYWRGDSKNPMLQRIYGTAFPSKNQLDNYLKQLEEAEKRNHIRMGKQLELFSMQPEGPGFPFWHSKGIIIYNKLMELWREEHEKENYKEIKTPVILNENLWKQSGHWDHYKESMYFTKIEGKEYAVKPMNCPGSMLVYRQHIHSYKEFPLRLSEIGLVHRHELSGVLNGLLRLRAFTQDDAHIFVIEDQIEKEVINIINLVQNIYKIFNFSYHVELSTRPSKSIGSDKMWNLAESSLKNALKKKKIRYITKDGEGAFYGPKIDFHIKDSLGRTWQCATVQVDLAMPDRFNLTYEGKDGKKHTPVVIHRVVFGSIERFIGILIEHFGGKFPLWLAPTQIIILTLTDKNKKFANEIKKQLKENNLRVELDDRPETISKKVRDSQVSKIPITITIGDKEQKNKTLAIRTLDGEVKFNVKINKFIQDVLKNIKNRNIKYNP